MAHVCNTKRNIQALHESLEGTLYEDIKRSVNDIALHVGSVRTHQNKF